MTNQTNADRREVVIDTEIAAAYSVFVDAQVEVERAEVGVHHDAGDRRSYDRKREWNLTLAEAIAKVEDLNLAGKALTSTAVTDYRATQTVAHAAYAAYKLADERYEGWSRFFLVTSSANGHIHSDMNCSSCNRSTGFAWLPSLSGLTAADAVAEQGERLCSVCYPDAPVAWHESYFADEKAARKAERLAAKTAKAEAKAAKAAARALTHHYYLRFTRFSDSVVINHDDTLTTLKAALRSAQVQNETYVDFAHLTVVDANTGEVVGS